MTRLRLILASVFLMSTTTSNSAGNDLLEQTFDGGWRSGDINFTCTLNGSEYHLQVRSGAAEVFIDGEKQSPNSIRYSPDIVIYLSGTRSEGTAYAIHWGKRTFYYQTYGPEFLEFGEKLLLDCPTEPQ